MKCEAQVKKAWPKLFCLAFLLICFFPSSIFGYTRIISLKPNLTEILFALGVGPQVVGVTKFCLRPEAAKALPKVADYMQAFPEQILHLKPDLILGTQENGSQKEIQFLLDRGLNVLTLGSAHSSSVQEVAQLKSDGIQIDTLGFSTIEETLNSIQALGILLRRETEAKTITAQMRHELNELKSKSQTLPKKRVLYVVGYQPLVVAGGNNFFDEAGDYIGATNVAHDSQLKYPNYTSELLIRAAPEVILDFAMGSESSEAAKASRKDFWQRFSSIPAVNNGQIYGLDIEKMRAAPSLPETLREIFELIHRK